MESSGNNLERLSVEIKKIHSFLQDRTEELETLQNMMCSLNTKAEDHESFNVGVDILSEKLREMHIDLRRIYESRLGRILNLFRPSFPWEINEEKFNYLSGNSPWEFSLVCSSKKVMDFMHKILNAYIERNGFEKLTRMPKMGEIILCVLKEKLFRGMYLGLTFDLRFNVLDIDNDIEFHLDNQNIFRLPDVIRDIPANTVRCCLLKDSFGQAYWSSGFKLLFQNILRQAKFTVRIIEPVSLGYPPRYLVALKGYTEDELIDISKWFSHTFYPTLIETEGHEELLSEQLHPFRMTPETEISGSASEPTSSMNLFTEAVDSVPTGDSANMLPGNSSTTAVPNENMRQAEFVDEEDSEVLDNLIDTENRHILEIRPSFNEGARICKFYMKKNHCWKQECRVEHIRPAGRDYLGAMYTHGYLEELLDLPLEGELVNLIPKCIINGHVFYAHIKGHSLSLDRTLKVLEQRMNNYHEVFPYKKLELLPSLGELVAALSDSSNCWFRARVVELHEQVVKVFSIDYGQEEYVKTENLRKLNYDLVGLPAQAVRCTLYDLRPVEPFSRLDAMIWLQKQILEKTLTASVETRDVLDSSMEVTLYLPNGDSVNELLLKRGIYAKISQ